MSWLIVDGPKVRDSKLLFGGRGQEEVAEGHSGGLGECFKLANGRLHRAVDPLGQPGKSTFQFILSTGPLHSPLQKFRFW